MVETKVQRDIQVSQDKLRELKARMNQRSPSNQTDQAMTIQRQEIQDTRAAEEEQMRALQTEMELIEKFQNAGIFRLETLRAQLKELDILVEFGAKMFEKLDILNINIERIANVLETKGIDNGQTAEVDEEDIPDDE